MAVKRRSTKYVHVRAHTRPKQSANPVKRHCRVRVHRRRR